MKKFSGKDMEESLGHKGALLVESNTGGVLQFNIMVSDIDVSSNQLTVELAKEGDSSGK